MPETTTYRSIESSAYPKPEVADRAGVEPSFVDRLVRLGILSPGEGGSFSKGDIRRIILCRTLGRAGVPIDEIAAAIKRGEVSLAFMDQRSMRISLPLPESPFVVSPQRPGSGSIS
jgi:DNA-binding transcriptional MerR regulator